MATKVEICNSAIAKVRGKRILTLNDDTVEARILTDIYPRVMDDLLRAHPWNFAKRRAALAQLSTAPIWGYEYAYQLPSDYRRLLKTDIPTGIPWELEEEKRLLTDYTLVNIQYIALVNESKFDSCFCEVLAFLLAEQLAYPLTQGTALAQQMSAMATKKLQAARSFNAQERGSIVQVEANEWLDSRY
jgi:hypothetical protein